MRFNYWPQEGKKDDDPTTWVGKQMEAASWLKSAPDNATLNLKQIGCSDSEYDTRFDTWPVAELRCWQRVSVPDKRQLKGGSLCVSYWLAQ